jgi:hypothetical protein
MQLDQQEQKRREAAEASARTVEIGTGAEGPGYVSRSRVAALHDMSVDLSAELNRKPKPLIVHKIPPEDLGLRVPTAGRAAHEGISAASPNDKRRYDRSRGYSRGIAAVAAAAEEPVDADSDAIAAAEIGRYQQLRLEYSLWTSGTAAIVGTACYFLYSRVRFRNASLSGSMLTSRVEGGAMCGIRK